MSPVWPRPAPLVGDTSTAAARAGDPAGWRFPAEDRDALQRIVAARRDVRRFRPDPLDPSSVQRVLAAAHAAPSVGHSQPWRFVLVAAPATRERAAAMAERQRLAQASQLAEDARRHLLDLQLHGIREAPLGIVVCCDRRAPAAGVLGRATFPDADLWSCACAIENLWLAARAEGLGVGWVTLFPPDELAGLVGAPEGVEPLGWLCIGWPDERPPAPGLESAGWSRRLPLEDVVLYERWSDHAAAPPVSRLRAPAPAAVVAARDAADTLLTSPGSLGGLDGALQRLTALGVTVPAAAVLVLAAADHPVTRHGVSTYPGSVTRQILAATADGVSFGAAFARAVAADVVAVDAGVDGPPVERALALRPTHARGDLVTGDALDRADVTRLVEAGRALAAGLSHPLVLLGEAGIGNTTVAAALAAGLLDVPATATTGLGVGGDAGTLAAKESAVAAALARVRAAAVGTGPLEPLAALAALGGPELAVLTGVVLGAAAAGRAVVLDGFVTSVAALCAHRLEPAVADHLVAGQRSRERGHAPVLEALGLEPLLDLRLRAGEGIGALLATQLLRTALAARATTARVGPTARGGVGGA
ncbi:MAG: 5,6-dimethylbenzimidazole synthase [Actinomycetota bacterium]|nr:5,6-dimethylbenzimidazole synthase [Actinomycetota bacterium]